MNTISIFLYLTDVLGAIDSFFLFMAFLSTIAIAAYSLMKIEPGDIASEWLERSTPVFKKFWIPFVFAISAVLIPSTNTMYMMAAAQTLESFSKIEQVQQLGGEAGALANDAIKMLRGKIAEAIEESTPKKRDE